jgi:hypothetical protein
LSSQLFSNKVKNLGNEEILTTYQLEEYKDKLDGFALIDENDNSYQEVVVLAAYDKNDYDALLVKFIGRLEDLKKAHGNKYGNLFKQNKNVVLKQEAGRIAFIVSENAKEIETTINGLYD